MYCPRCAEPNVEGAKFCRACGEDLSVIAQVLARRFPASLLGKMDAYLERKNERIRRDSIVSAVAGAAFLFVSLYHLLVQGEGLSNNVVFMFLMASFMLVWSAWDFLVFRRSLSRAAAPEPPPAPTTNELTTNSPLGLKESPPLSVTEQTTRHLDPVSNRPNKKP
jgi:hypothetical protein